MKLRKKDLKEQVMKFLIFLGVSILIILVIASIWEGKDMGWGKWVYEYQALITGITATLAASITIYQTKKQIKAQDSHNKSEKSLRAEIAINRVNRVCAFLKNRFYTPRVFIEDYINDGHFFWLPGKHHKYWRAFDAAVKIDYAI